MRKLTLLIALVAVLAAGPARADAPPTPEFLDLLLATLLKLGDYKSVYVDVQKAQELPLPDLYRQRFGRYRAMCFLVSGLGRQALELGESLEPQVSDPGEELALQLLMVEAARRASLPEPFRRHLEKAEQLAARGPLNPVHGYLLETWRFQRDFERDPGMPAEEILRRHQRALEHLRRLLREPAALEPLTRELHWAGDCLVDVWSRQLTSRRAREPALSSLQASDGELFAVLATDCMGKGHPELLFSLARVAIQGARADQEEGNLARADEVLTRWGRQLDFSRSEIARVEQSSAPEFKALRDQGWQMRFEAGELQPLLAQLHLLRARQMLRQTPADTRGIGSELAQAAPLASDLDSSAQVFCDLIDYLLELRPPGWEEIAEKTGQSLVENVERCQDRRYLAASYYRRALVSLALNRNDRALEDLRRSAGLVEDYIRELGGSDASADHVRELARPIYDLLARLEIQSGRTQDALATVGRLQQLETPFRAEDLRPRLPEPDQKLLTAALESKQQAGSLEGELVALRQDPAANAQRIQATDQLLARTRKDYYAIVSDLQQRYPAFEKLDVKPINFSKLQRAIPSEAAVVLYFACDQELYSFVMTSSDLRIHRVGVSRAELDGLVRRTRLEVLRYSRQRQGPAFRWDSPEAAELKAALCALDGWLVEPLRADLQSKTVLAFVPYAGLSYLPFGALLRSHPDGSVRFLIEDYQVALLMKAADLDQLYGGVPPRSGSLVALGNPDGTLANAEEEVKALKELLPGARVYTGAQASLEHLREARSPEVSYLHLATHGELDCRNPLDSSLTLGKGVRLLVRDIPSLDLGTDMSLVTLSACQTSLGEPGANPNGSDLRTLAEAFSFAGGRTVVASLWSVDDARTRDLMVAFYTGLKEGRSKAEALREAQLALLHREGTCHPYYWASFILIGDWR